MEVRIGLGSAVVRRLAVPACIVLCGCASLESKRVDLQESGPIAIRGLTYYLPMRYAEVTFERRLLVAKPTITIQQAQTKLDASTAAAKAAGAASAQASARFEAIRATGIPATAKVYHEAALMAVEAQLASIDAISDLDDAKALLAKAIADAQSWDAAQAQCGYRDRFAVTLQKPVADTTAKFSVELRHQPTRNDEWSLETTTSGLLSTVEGTIEDQSAEILVALAKSSAALGSGDARSLGTYARSMNQASPFASPPPTLPCDFDWKPIMVQRLIDPADESQWNGLFHEINDAATVQCKPGNAACKARPFFYGLAGGSLKRGRVPDGKDAVGTGIYYRRELPLQIRIVEASGHPPLDAGAFLLIVPNHSSADFMPLEASPFVTTTHGLEFDNGILVGVESNRPSELLRVAALPWDVAAATIGAVAELVRLRVDYSTGNAELIEQQVDLLKQLKAQIEAQQALEAARRAASDRGTDSDVDPSETQ